MMHPDHRTAILNAAATALAREISTRVERLDELRASGAPETYLARDRAKIGELWGAAKSLGVLGAVSTQVSTRTLTAAHKIASGRPDLIGPEEIQP